VGTDCAGWFIPPTKEPARIWRGRHGKPRSPILAPAANEPPLFVVPPTLAPTHGQEIWTTHRQIHLACIAPVQPQSPNSAISLLLLRRNRHCCFTPPPTLRPARDGVRRANRIQAQVLTLEGLRSLVDFDDADRAAEGLARFWSELD